MKVGKVMNRKLETIEPKATVLDAIEKLVDKKNQIIGSQTGRRHLRNNYHQRYCLQVLIGRHGTKKNVKVKEITSKPLIYVEKDMSIEPVLKLMKKFNIARVFVKEENRVVGVVALMDIVATCLVSEKL